MDKITIVALKKIEVNFGQGVVALDVGQEAQLIASQAEFLLREKLVELALKDKLVENVKPKKNKN
jgi:hypothetical protein